MKPNNKEDNKETSSIEVYLAMIILIFVLFAIGILFIYKGDCNKARCFYSAGHPPSGAGLPVVDSSCSTKVC